MRPPPELSCYTTALVGYLELVDGGPVRERLAEAVRLAVRTGPGGLAFSQHRRIDRAGGWELVYRGAADWATARAALHAELRAWPAVLAVGNSRHLPWSPHHRRSDLPHWILLTGHDGRRWQVRDDFAALLPAGPQEPYRGRLDDGELRAALTPLPALPAPIANRDVHALGEAAPPPPPGQWRWLARRPAGAARPLPGRWLHDPSAALSFLGDRLTGDGRALAEHADDLWAAARHHRHRLAVLAAVGALPAGPAEAAAASWSELPRALRFAVESAARGRPRPGVVGRAFDDVLTTMSRVLPQEVLR
jgi:hypothetical protein